MSRIAIIGENSVEFIKILIRIWNANDCAVIIDWRTSMSVAYSLMLDAGVTKCYMERDLYDHCFVRTHSQITFILYDNNNKNKAVILPKSVINEFQRRNDKSEALIIFSSGTTGKSKGIILSHYAIDTNSEAIIQYMKLLDESCLYIAKSLSHSSTLVGELLVSLKARLNIIVGPTTVSPRFALEMISHFSVNILCVNPALLRAYCDEIHRCNYNFSSLHTIYVSGSVLTDSLYNIAHETFRNVKVFNVYGLTEAGPRVSAQTVSCCKGNSVGKPINGVKIVVVKENGSRTLPGEHGIIHIKSDGLFSGYVIGNEKHTPILQGWFNTGDIGFFDNYGELHVVGRVDDLIICNAHKIYPIDVENLIMDDPMIKECSVNKFYYKGYEAIGCLYVCEIDKTKSIIHRLRGKLTSWEIPKKYIRVDCIPRNIQGKIDRNEVSNYLNRN